MSIGDRIAPRVAFGEAITELGRASSDVVVLDADVSTSTMTCIFRDAFPDRFYNVGIAEQHMFTMAAGIASTGLIPFVSTFACFATRRAADQIHISIAYTGLNVKINGAYGGVAVGQAGATHQAFEDLAIMRAIPNMVVLDLCDAVETRAAVFAAADYDGPVYLRTVRCEVPVIFDEAYDFEIGRGYVLRDGSDVAIVSSGMMTPKALDAAAQLESLGISARVLHYPTLKPFDRGPLVRAAHEIGRFVTIENHSVIGGLGSTVAEVLAEEKPSHVRRLGMQDSFGESGDDEAFLTKYGMNTQHIVQAARELAKE
ncbi:MAG: transketolase family protein [Myxococcales bacterium]|nr:transketolase family protein [Myxococcales bacterium]HIK83704.1 transketolase family protein [Myxococcales bacterium]